MRNCPTTIDIANFIDDALERTEAELIRSHLGVCHKCSHDLADVLSIKALEEANMLPHLTENELRQMTETVKRLGKSGQFLKRKEQPVGQSSLRENLKVFSAAILGAVGTTETGNSTDDLDPVHGLAQEKEKFSNDHGRNDEVADSQVRNNEKLSTEEPDKEATMTDNKNSYANSAPTVVGVPEVEGQSPLVQQSHADTCAVRCQELILRDFGVDVSEDMLCYEAATNGWYTAGGGTLPEHVGNLLELHGVHVNHYQNANIFTLTSELAQGNKVIIGVDSGELWDNDLLEILSDKMGLEQADHAVIVSGIDTSDPNNVQVIITDPGSGDVAKAYPMDQFIDAWKDSNCMIVATKEPAPLEYNPEMINFDYMLGHLSNVGALEYDSFQTIFSSCIGLEGNSTLIQDQAKLLIEATKSDQFASQLADTYSENDYSPDSNDISGRELVDHHESSNIGSSDSSVDIETDDEYDDPDCDE